MNDGLNVPRPTWRESTMAESVIRCSCPHCDGHVRLKDRQFIGKKIKCPQCQKPFLVEAPDEEDPEQVEHTRRTKANKTQADVENEPSHPRKEYDEEEERGRKNRSPRDEDEDKARPGRKIKRVDDEEEERPRKKKKKKKRSVLPWLLAGGGVTAVAALALVVVLLVNKGPGKAGDLLVDVDGPWAELGALAGTPNIITFQIAVPGISLHKSGQEAQDMEEAIADRIVGLLEPYVDPIGHPSFGHFYDAPRGGGRRMVIRHGRVNEEAQVIAKRVDFGTVRCVEGRTITLVVSTMEGLPHSDDVARALFRLKSPDPKRRPQGAESLRKLPPDHRRAEVAKWLEPLATDKNPFTRERAIDALGFWGTQETGAFLLKLLSEDKFATSVIIRSLGRRKERRASEPLAEFLGKFLVGRDAVQALKNIGPAAENAVLKRLSDPNREVRQQVCEILEVIGSKQSIPALEKMAASDGDLKGAAEKAIKAIGARS